MKFTLNYEYNNQLVARAIHKHIRIRISRSNRDNGVPFIRQNSIILLLIHFTLFVFITLTLRCNEREREQTAQRETAR